ncbi:MAG: hypothetical protein ACJAVV_003868 [Alphaproteobacteria bacterium]|jgi:hypothetical protein
MLNKNTLMVSLLVSLVLFASPTMANKLQTRFENRLQVINKAMIDSYKGPVPSNVCEFALKSLKKEYRETKIVVDNLVCSVDSNGKLQIMSKKQ